MKKCIVLIIFLSAFVALHSQKDSSFVYLFDDFRKGTVIFKSGAVSQSFFNYELISQKIHFKSENNTVLELLHPESIEYINIEEYTFEHIRGSVFYQKINLGSLDLYVRHTVSLSSKGRYVGFGYYSAIASVDIINQINIDRTKVHTKFDINEKYDVKKVNIFYIKRKGKFKRIYSANSLAKLFKGHEEEIKDAIEEENTDFKEVKDVAEAVRFCGELLEE